MQGSEPGLLRPGNSTETQGTPVPISPLLLRHRRVLQASIVLHSGEKTPGHSRFTGAPLFQQAGATAFILPGYSESLGAGHQPLAFGATCWATC